MDERAIGDAVQKSLEWKNIEVDIEPQVIDSETRCAITVALGPVYDRDIQVDILVGAYFSNLQRNSG